MPRAALVPEELADWVAGCVAPHKRLGAVLLAERIPRTASGKILRRELRALAAIESS